MKQELNFVKYKIKFINLLFLVNDYSSPNASFTLACAMTPEEKSGARGGRPQSSFRCRLVRLKDIFVVLGVPAAKNLTNVP